jgi:hypothetical protein
MLKGYTDRMRRPTFGPREEPRECSECGGVILRCLSTRRIGDVVVRYRRCKCGERIKTVEDTFTRCSVAMSATC